MQLNAILKPFPRELFTILPALSSPCEMMYLLFHIHESFKKLQKIHIYFLFKEHTLHKQQKYPNQIKKAPSPFSEKRCLWRNGNVRHGFLADLQADHCHFFVIALIFILMLPQTKKSLNFQITSVNSIQISYVCNFPIYLFILSNQKKADNFDNRCAIKMLSLHANCSQINMVGYICIPLYL